MVKLSMGQTAIAVAGTLTKPTDLAALDMGLKVSGVSMGRLYALIGIVLPETPPFMTEGHLIGILSPHGDRWSYEKFSGKVGSSDITGNLNYQSKQPRALLSGSLVSRLLQFSDLAPMIGADSNASKLKRGRPQFSRRTKYCRSNLSRQNAGPVSMPTLNLPPKKLFTKWNYPSTN